MKYLIDTHTHTLASGHAYNTIDEMTRHAADIGLAHLAITDHTPKMPGSAHKLYFSNLKAVYREKYGVHRYMGCEVNIMDYDGKLDLSDRLLEQMDVVIASFHIPCIKPGSVKENTRALLKVISNPNVDIIGHPDDGRYPVNIEEIVLAAKKEHKLLELNNSSLKPGGPREGTFDHDIKMLELCKKHGVTITLGSDAHVAEDICNFTYAQKVIDLVDFPDRLIVNTDIERFQSMIRMF